MTIRRGKPQGAEGGVLLVTLLICVILGTLIGSYLSLIQNQHLSSTRAQAWNSGLVVAEAGIEEAMAHLNSGVKTNNLAVNSWVDMGGGVYEKTNFLGDSYSVVDIKIPPAVTNADPVIVATAYVPGPVGRPMLTRTLQVATKPRSITGVPGGMVARASINLKGSGIFMDSFDSSDTNYSTGGMYDPKKARDRAQATVLSPGTNVVQVDNGTIKGYVHTAPGGTVAIGSGAVGDAAWITCKKPGIEPGHALQDAATAAPDVSLPSGVSWLAPSSGKYKVNGFNYKYSLNNAAAWKISSLSGSIYVSSPGVVLYVDSTLSIGSGEQIFLAPGASLTLYVGAPDANIGGNGVVNQGGRAKDFVYYGLPSNKSLGLSANAAFTGSINAPSADFTLGGGGNNTYDFAGACVVNSVVMNGHFNFHYDESLPNTAAPVSSGFVAMSWDEL
jgi:hypothetical protein